MATLLLTRPDGRNEALKAEAQRAGFEVLHAPLLSIHPIAHIIPDGVFDALLLTSAEAVRMATEVRHLPVYAVGPATAGAARAAGLKVVATGASDGRAIVRRALADGVRRLLHLRGRDGADLSPPAEIDIITVPVYRAEQMRSLPADVLDRLRSGGDTVVPLFSPRTAAAFRHIADDAGLPKAGITVVVISKNTATAAGPGWKHLTIAGQPTTAAMLAAACAIHKEGSAQDDG